VFPDPGHTGPEPAAEVQDQPAGRRAHSAAAQLSHRLSKSILAVERVVPGAGAERDRYRPHTLVPRRSPDL